MKKIFKENRMKNGIVKIDEFIEFRVFSYLFNASPYNITEYPCYFIWNNQNNKFDQITAESSVRYKNVFSMKDIISRKKRRSLINEIKLEIRQARIVQLLLKSRVPVADKSVRLQGMVQSNLSGLKDYLSYLYASLMLLNFNDKDTHGKETWDILKFLNKKF